MTALRTGPHGRRLLWAAAFAFAVTASQAVAQQTTIPPGFDAVPRPPGQFGGQGFMPPGGQSGVLAPNPSPLELAPPSRPVSLPPPAAPSWNARVVLYEEDPADPQGKRYVGSAIWRTEAGSPGPGEPADLAVVADLEIPERRMTMTFTLRRNRDKALPASHTIEFNFNL